MSLRDVILGVSDSDLQEYPVPEWGCSVYLKTWSGKDRAKFHGWYQQNKDKAEVANIAAYVVALSVCDEQGQRLFSDKDVALLNDKNASVLDRISNAVLTFNKVTGEAIEDAKKN